MFAGVLGWRHYKAKQGIEAYNLFGNERPSSETGTDGNFLIRLEGSVREKYKWVSGLLSDWVRYQSLLILLLSAVSNKEKMVSVAKTEGD